MATPSVKGKNGADSPTHTNVPINADSNQPVNVHIVLRGTRAQVAADWATLAATSFTASAVMTWTH